MQECDRNFLTVDIPPLDGSKVPGTLTGFWRVDDCVGDVQAGFTFSKKTTILTRDLLSGKKTLDDEDGGGWGDY